MGTGRPVLEQRLRPAAKGEAAVRLRRVEGQIRGLVKMVEEDRYSVEILGQIASVQEALRGVGKLIIRNYIQTCGSEAIRKGGRQAEEVNGEILDIMYKYTR